jgi:hypothetical protein
LKTELAVGWNVTPQMRQTIFLFLGLVLSQRQAEWWERIWRVEVALLLAFPAVLACLLFYSVWVLVKERGLKSTRAKRNAAAVIIIVIALAAYGLMCWIVGEAGYNQTLARWHR